MPPKSDNEVYRVIVDGYCLADAQKPHVVKKLKRLFGKPEEKILEMFDGQPTVIKNNLPKSKAYQYLRTITNAGAACHIDKLNNVNPEETTQLPVHVERNSFIKSLDPLGKIKKRIQQRNDFLITLTGFDPLMHVAVFGPNFVMDNRAVNQLQRLAEVAVC